MSRKRSKDTVDFAIAVRNLYDKASRSELDRQHEQDRDVRRVAFGLANVRRLVDAQARAFKEAGAYDEKISSAIRESLAILDALTSGRTHPIFDYIDGLRSLTRSQRALLNGIDEQAQAAIIGFVWAYQRTAKCDRAEAIRTVCRTCKNSDFALSKTLIGKSWMRNLGADLMADEALQALVSAGEIDTIMKTYGRRIGGAVTYYSNIIYAAQNRSGDGPLVDKVVDVGRAWIDELWSVPFAQGEQPTPLA